jgi:hypothetical protein
MSLFSGACSIFAPVGLKKDGNGYCIKKRFSQAGDHAGERDLCGAVVATADSDSGTAGNDEFDQRSSLAIEH